MAKHLPSGYELFQHFARDKLVGTLTPYEHQTLASSHTDEPHWLLTYWYDTEVTNSYLVSGDNCNSHACSGKVTLSNKQPLLWYRHIAESRYHDSERRNLLVVPGEVDL